MDTKRDKGAIFTYHSHYVLLKEKRGPGSGSQNVLDKLYGSAARQGYRGHVMAPVTGKVYTVHDM